MESFVDYTSQTLADKDKNQVFVLIGAPASGKSTWARSHFDDHEIVSSDMARQMICGDETNQHVTGAAWSVVYSLIRAKLQTGQARIVVDATSAKRKDRANLVQYIRTWMPDNTRIIGIAFLPHVDTLVERDANRERTVGAEIIGRMLQALKSNPPSLDDGFDRLIVHDNEMNLPVEGGIAKQII